jgi:regulator of replication initiation timing
MDILKKKFEDRMQNFRCKSNDMKEENSELHKENNSLRGEIQRLRNELEDKTVEAYEAKEMNGIYSAKLTKLDRKFKKLKEEEDESYMELTF